MIKKRKPTHPGVLLYEEVLKPLGLTITQASKDLGVSRKNLSELVNGKISLSPDMAVRISKATNTTAESWMIMQSNLDLWESENKEIFVTPFPTFQEEYDIMKG